MNITHVLGDGTRLEDISGHIVKKKDAEEVYNLIEVMNEKEGKRKDAKEVKPNQG